jgi:hypothetical protein
MAASRPARLSPHVVAAAIRIDPDVARGSRAWVPAENDPEVVRQHFTRYRSIERELASNAPRKSSTSSSAP